jgi:hypothetical protein
VNGLNKRSIDARDINNSSNNVLEVVVEIMLLCMYWRYSSIIGQGRGVMRRRRKTLATRGASYRVYSRISVLTPS